MRTILMQMLWRGTKSRILQFASRSIAAFVVLAAYPVAADQFANPIDVLVADPHVLYDEGTYYLYGTSNIAGFKVWSSPDLVNWTYERVAWRSTAQNWGQNRFWAPEVIRRGSTYYMFYSAGGSPNDIMRICVATATSPVGPFTDAAAPLFDNGQSYIDGHVFFNDNETPYLYMAQDMSVPADNKSEIVVVQLAPDLLSIVGNPVLCITPTQTWETAGGGYKWNEAPVVLKQDNFYIMLYSGNVYSSNNYSIGYATATTPLGPWSKYTGNPVLTKKPNVSGPGHCSVVPSPDGTQLWMAYHTHQQPDGGGARQLAVDRLQITRMPSGPPVLSMPGAPTLSMIAPPAGSPAFPAGGTDTFTGPLDRDRWIVFNESRDNYLFTSGDMRLTLEKGDTHSGSSDMKNVFLQYPPYTDFRVTLDMTFSAPGTGEQTGIFIWQDHNNYIRFANFYSSLGPLLESGRETNSTFNGQFLWGHVYPAHLYMKIEKLGDSYRCFASSDNATWTEVGSQFTYGFQDIKIGMYGTSLGSPGGRIASFHSFTVEPLVAGVSDWTVY